MKNAILSVLCIFSLFHFSSLANGNESPPPGGAPQTELNVERSGFNRFTLKVLNFLVSQPDKAFTMGQLSQLVDFDERQAPRYVLMRMRRAIKDINDYLRMQNPHLQRLVRGDDYVLWLSQPLPRQAFATFQLMNMPFTVSFRNLAWRSFPPMRITDNEEQVLRKLIEVPSHTLTFKEINDLLFFRSAQKLAAEIESSGYSVAFRLRQKVLAVDPNFPGLIYDKERLTLLTELSADSTPRTNPKAHSASEDVEPSIKISCERALSSYSVEELMDAINSKGWKVWLMR